MKELRLKTAAHYRLWHLGDAGWSVDQDTGEIVFSAPLGLVVTCPFQIIGTFDANDFIWLSAWDQPSLIVGQAIASTFPADHSASKNFKSGADSYSSGPS